MHLLTRNIFIGTALLACTGVLSAQTELVKAGESSFVQQCAFCHGRDTGGGEDGPDLTRSKLVTEDVGGDKPPPLPTQHGTSCRKQDVKSGSLAPST